MSCKLEILKQLEAIGKPLAIHEFKIIGYSQNNIATRLNDLERECKLKSNYRSGERFKEWYLCPVSVDEGREEREKQGDPVSNIRAAHPAKFNHGDDPMEKTPAYMPKSHSPAQFEEQLSLF